MLKVEEESPKRRSGTFLSRFRRSRKSASSPPPGGSSKHRASSVGPGDHAGASGGAAGAGVGSNSAAKELRARIKQLEAEQTLKQKNKEFTVSLSVGSLQVAVVVSSQTTVGQAKAQVTEAAAALPGVDPLELLEPGLYTMKVVGIPVYLTSDHLPVHRVSIVQVCTKTFVAPRFELVPTYHVPRALLEQQAQASKRASGAEAKELHDPELDLRQLKVAEVLLQKDLESLIPHLGAYLGVENTAVTTFRKHMTRMRLEFASELATRMEEEDTYMLHKYQHAEPLPPNPPANITIACVFPGAESTSRTIKKLACESCSTVTAAIEKCFRKYALLNRDASADKQASDYILKVTGFQDFLFGEDTLLDYDYVRRCVGKNLPLELTLVETSRIIAQYPKERIDYFSIVDKILEAPELPQALIPIKASTSPEAASGSGSARSSSSSPPPTVTTTPTTPTTTTTTTTFSSPPSVSTSTTLAPRATSAGNKHWRLKLKRVEGLSSLQDDEVAFVRLAYYNGDEQYMPAQTTKPMSSSADRTDQVSWEEWLFTSVKIADLPLGSRVSLSVWTRKVGKERVSVIDSVDPKDICHGWVNQPLFNRDGTMLSGLKTFSLWRDELDPVGTCIDNVFAKYKVHLFMEFASTRGFRKVPEPVTDCDRSFREPDPDVTERLMTIVNQDPLHPLSKEDMQMLWNFRHHLIPHARALPKVLLSVPWTNAAAVNEAYGLLQRWSPIDAPQALQLVSSRFSDPLIREHGVSYVDKLSDSEVLDYLPQLTQALKHEMFHDSPLASLLVKRAFRNRHRIGNALFWYLKAEMHLPKIAERYGLLLETYLRGCGSHRKELLKQDSVVNDLVEVAVKIKDIPKPKERLVVLRKLLSNLKFPPVFQLSLDPRYEVKGLITSKCKFMDSKKLPLWLVFENAEEGAPPIMVIFKEGDDLRQDVLTIQLLRLMDKLWKQAGMDLRMHPYGCVSNGDQIGLIEIVQNAATTAGINIEAGGAKYVFKEEPLAEWLQKNNPAPQDYKQAVENFTLSCAAYCVATFVLGIGDRHNDNIMVTKKGHLFHIDFGHFLGNYKKKFGIKRERAPFVFTPQYAYVLGGRGAPAYERFVSLCQKAYNLIRQQADLFITLFYMMLPCGIPELQVKEDIDYLRLALALELTEEEAASRFAELIEESLDTRTTLLNDWAHIVAHSGKCESGIVSECLTKCSS